MPNPQNLSQNHSKIKLSHEIRNNKYSPFGELIPNLTQLALKNTNFSPTNALGGIIQNSNSVNTITGTIAHLCAIPLIMPFYRNDFIYEYFLDSAVCLSDILHKLGYKQAYFLGVDSAFAGTKYLFLSHSVEVFDLPYFQSANLVPNPLPPHLRGYWDLSDSAIFNLAKNYLESMGDLQPFALYISTLDTHSGSSFVDKERCAGISENYKGAILCSDKIISEFVKWVQNSRFGDRTTIIILGDHLSHQQFFFPQGTERFIYNAFINPRFTQKPTLKRTKNRQITHFDITPLILDSLGIATSALGLGRNPLYGETLIESEFDLEQFNALIWQRNKIYDTFWEIKKRE